MNRQRCWILGVALATLAWLIALVALGSLLLGCGGDSGPPPDISTPYINCHRGTCV